jgi:1,4-dihydroxy-2-naphthoate octaprenyltransferase
MALRKNQFEWDIFILAITTTTLLQVLSNLANDYGDTIKGTDNVNRVGPERALQSGKISRKEMIIAITINSFLALISGIALIFTSLNETENIVIVTFLIIGIAAIFAAIKYTMGKNPYGYSGMGDLFVFIFFGLVGVIGTYYLYTNNFESSVIFPAATIGLLSAAVLNMNNMRDEENDKAYNKNTLVVKIGLKNAKVYHSLLIILAFIGLVLTLLVTKAPQLTYICFIPFIILFKNVQTTWRTTIRADFDPELKKIALSTFAISLLFTISIIIGQH